MKRIIYLALVATMFCCTLVFTACSSEDIDNSSVNQEIEKERNELLAHIQDDARIMADSLNFDMLNTTAQVNGQLLSSMAKGRNFLTNMKKLIGIMAVQNAMQHVKSVAAGSELAGKGYTAYLPLDISAFGVRVVFDERGNYNVTPAEGLEFIFPATLDGVGTTAFKMSLKNNGEWYESVSPTNFGNVKGLACISRIPKAMTMKLTGLLNENEVTLLTGILNIEMEKNAESQYVDFYNNAFAISGQLMSTLKGSQYGLPDDDSTLSFNLSMNESGQADIAYNFEQNGMNVLNFGAQVTLPQKEHFIEQIAGDITSLSDFTVGNMILILGNAFSNSQAVAEMTILDDLILTGTIRDGSQFFQALQDIVAKRNDKEVTTEEWKEFVQKFNDSYNLLIGCEHVTRQVPMQLFAIQSDGSLDNLPALKFADKTDYIALRTLLTTEAVDNINKIYETTATPVSNAAGVGLRLLSSVVLMMPMNSKEWGF
ncbi:MAG: hypothetical protein J6W52_11160 [Bacteroidaceae bacterium]|nr:hypothetical protein [Bacteroidaceae bacterium]